MSDGVVFSRLTHQRLRPEVAFPARYKKYPARIRQFIYRIYQEADTLALARGGIKVLQALVATGFKGDDPSQRVFARKETIAKCADVSEATVYRTLDKLAKAGWIERCEQGRLLDGSHDVAELGFTDRFISLMFSDVTSKSQQDVTVDNKHQNRCTNTAPQVEPVSAQTSTSQASYASSVQATENQAIPADLTDGLRDGLHMVNNEVDPEASVNNQSTGAYVPMNGRKVPVGLVWLIEEKRLSFGQLFKLMKQAKQVVRQKLEDFVELRKDVIKALPGIHDCFRYLRKLIDEGVDARYMVEQRRRKEAAAAVQKTRAKVADQVSEWSKVHHGEMFENASGEVFRVHGTGAPRAEVLYRNGVPAGRVIPIDRGFVHAVRSGRLTTWVKGETAEIGGVSMAPQAAARIDKVAAPPSIGALLQKMRAANMARGLAAPGRMCAA